MPEPQSVPYPPQVGPAAATGNTRAALEALRDRLAYTLDQTNSARDVASLASRLADVLEALELLDEGEPQTDEIADLLAWPRRSEDT